MKTKTSSRLNAKSVRDCLKHFWSDHLGVETKLSEIVITLPLLYPNGIQVVLSVRELSSTSAILSDNGEVITSLDERSIDIRKKTANREMLDERIKAFELFRSGIAIQKKVNLPLDGLDVHLFGEALVSISHLIYRHEYEVQRSEHVYARIRKLLVENAMPFKEKDEAHLSGQVEENIRFDFLTLGKRPLACKTIERRGRMRDYMEQWGYRWRDLRDKHQNIGCSMFYDPENQTWDDETLRIGKSVCDIFVPYTDVVKIQEELARYVDN
jgi:hypothetical protein